MTSMRPAAAAALVLSTAVVLAGPGIGAAATPAAPASTPSPAPPKRNIAGPGDYGIREAILQMYSRDPEISRERFGLVLVNGGAYFSGTISTFTLKMRMLRMAATVRGVVNLVDETEVRRAELSDGAIARAVREILESNAAALGLERLEVKVDDGVVRLEGKAQDFNARQRAQDLAGGVLGITRVSNHLIPANAPAASDDAALARAVVAYLGDWRNLSQSADIEVSARGGEVTLNGRATLYLARQQAGLLASLVGGVTGVDNRIKVDPSLGRTGPPTAPARVRVGT